MNKQGLSLIVKTIIRWIKGFVFLFGLYLMLTGDRSTGGGFAGGIILACSFILMVLALGGQETLKHMSKVFAFNLVSIGMLIMLALAIGGKIFGDAFFANFLKPLTPEARPLLVSGTMPLFDLGVLITVFADVFMVFIILAAIRVVKKAPEEEFEELMREWGEY